MAMYSSQASRYRYRPSLGSRLTAVVLSLAILALIILILIRMGLLAPGAGSSGAKLTAVTFRAQSADHPKRRAITKTVRRRQQRLATEPKATPRAQPQPRPIPPLHLQKLTREEFAAADISKMPRHPAEASSGSAAGPNGAAANGPGEGPGGARLYNAEWYREPTHAELATYMPHRDVAGGWAMIACRTQEGYHVDDCRELGESPPGSGLARALRLAAWQFLVRPPRLDGRPIIGAWVRIRFDFTPAAADDKPEANSG